MGNAGEDFTVDRTLDCRGSFCPVPIIEAKEALKALMAGQVLEVLSTDPGSTADFPAFARNTGHELLATRVEKDTFTFYLRRAS